MIFTSLTFLGFYLCLLALLFVVKNNKGREYILLLSSYVFYGAWNPVFVLLIFVSSLWGWFLGLLINSSNNKRHKKIYVALSILLSLGMLGYYKYANFFMQNIYTNLGFDWEYMEIILPVGISFFTFQTLSYTIDLYRGRIGVCKDLHRFMLFVAFFPQLVAGPIVRASEFLPQLHNHIKLKWHDLLIGGQIFLGGAIQKVLFADNFSGFVDPVFATPELFSTSTLWLALTAYSMQIFCDFAGYSMMAVGIARTLGFKLPENFRMPYISCSITEFWRRWHMTLSFWLRDYLYISLGGNRKGNVRTYINLMVTMLLGGLWHGASWNFILWGGAQGVALALHKYWEVKTSHLSHIKDLHSYKVFAWSLTLLVVMLLWVPFRCSDFSVTVTYFSGLFDFDEGGLVWTPPHVVGLLVLAALWHLAYIWRLKALFSFPSSTPSKAYPSFIIILTLLTIAFFAPLNTSPFIYFQF